MWLKNKLTNLIFLKFLSVGGLVTLLHIFIVVVSIEFLDFNQLLSNSIAYVTSNFFAFLINTKWSFREAPTRNTFFKYQVVSATSFFILVLITSISDRFGFHYLIGLLFVILVIPFFTYLMHKYWTYRSPGT